MPSGVRAVRTLRRKATPETFEFFEELEALVESREVFERAAGELLEGEVLHHEDYDEGFRADDPVELEVVLDRARAAGGALDAFCERVAQEAGGGLACAYERCGCKGFGRASDKVRSEYGGEARFLRDGARGSLAARDGAALGRVLRTMMRSNGGG